MTRREAREAAFLLLFEWSFREDETVEEIIELARHCRDAQIDDFAAMLADRAVAHIIAINHEIEQFSDKWKLNRLSRVTLAVLRMGICELGYIEDIPVGATINEAVELMKKYATEDEAAYVNGVLGAYHRGRIAAPGEAVEPQTPVAEAEAPEQPAASVAEKPVADVDTADMPSLDDIASAIEGD